MICCHNDCFYTNFSVLVTVGFSDHNLETLETYENRILNVTFFVDVLRPQNACHTVSCLGLLSFKMVRLEHVVICINSRDH